jgi:hypothetical protein
LLNVSGIPPDHPGEAGIILPSLFDEPLQRGARIGFRHVSPLALGFFLDK